MSNQLAIEYVPVDKLKLNPKNPRKNDENVSAVVKSMAAFGWTNPILARRANNMVIAGHTRLKAAIEKGIKKVPVVYLDLDENDADVYMVADNKMVENADWDFPKLADLLVDFDQLNVDLELTGFSMDEIEDIAPATFGPPERDDDDVIPESPPPVCKTGDLWLLGNHRLLCGDCTTQANVERLMAGEKADMVFTDPPYGVDLDVDFLKIHKKNKLGHKGRQHPVFEKVKGDDAEYNPSHILIFYEHCQEIFLWGADNFLSGLGNGGSWFVWDKVVGRFEGRIGNEFELCWSKKRHKKTIMSFLWVGHKGLENQDTKSRIHPTQKPVGVCNWFVNEFSKKEGTVADPFLGSGTTLIACEKLNRRCYGMEIDEHYCDVIIKRWEDYTGGKAVLDESP